MRVGWNVRYGKVRYRGRNSESSVDSRSWILSGGGRT
jgi:hypothetical protein